MNSTTLLLMALLIVIALVILAVPVLLILRRRAKANTTSDEAFPTALESLSQLSDDSSNASTSNTSATEVSSADEPNLTTDSSSIPTPTSVSPSITESSASAPVNTASALSQPVSTNGQSASDEGKIRILIIDDNEETIEHVTRLLYFEDDLEVVGQANRGQLGIDMARETQPHIVLMDINMPDMDGITATRKLTEEVPYAQVIMISVQSDQEYMKRAMLAGARDYQPKPFSVDELVSSIRRVYKLGQSEYERVVSEQTTQIMPHMESQAPASKKNGRVIAVHSPKGGVGTSVIAANLAAVLQHDLGDVVLMDADFQFGDVLVLLHTQPTQTMADLVRSEGFEAELLPDILIQHETGLNVLLGPPRPESAELLTPLMITDIIQELRDRFGTVVIDTQNMLNNQTLTVLESVDYVLVVANPELPAIKNIRVFVEVAQAINLTTDQMALVVNRANQEGGIAYDRIVEALKLPHSYKVPLDKKIIANINSGKVITQLNGKTAFAKAIVSLAKSLQQTLTQRAVEVEDEDALVGEVA